MTARMARKRVWKRSILSSVLFVSFSNIAVALSSYLLKTSS
jgi:hypothetical protein